MLEILKSYPYFRVVMLYAILGGLVGGALFGFTAAISAGKGLMDTLFLAIMMAGITAFLGVFVGAIPATVCGVLVAITRSRRNVRGYVQAVLFGFLSVRFFNINSFHIKNMFEPFSWLDLFGAISSLIVFYWVAPAVESVQKVDD